MASPPIPRLILRHELAFIACAVVSIVCGLAHAEPPAYEDTRMSTVISVKFGTPTSQPPEPPPQGSSERSSNIETLQSAAVLPPAEEHPIDLSTALQLAERQNPAIGLARQAIEEALAGQMQARALMAPTLRAGMNYRLHQGVLQTPAGLMRRVNSSSLYAGNGAGAVGSGTVAFPGVQVFSHLGDGIFEPLAARQLVAARQFQADAIANQVLLEVAIAFLELVQAEAALTAFRQSEQDLDEVVRITAAYAKVKAGREADALRARTQALLLRADGIQAEENVAVASAALTRTLSLDPAIRLRTPADWNASLQLVDTTQSLEQLIAKALAGRPELPALQAEIDRRRTQVRQEKTRPLLPTIVVNFSAGTFGGGTNRSDLVPIHPEFGRFGGRTDVDVLAYWTMQNMGIGNVALRKERQAEEGLAVIDLEREINLIRREVATAYAQVNARRKDLSIARSRLETAEAAFRQDLIRIKGNVGLPIELLNSVNRLAQARENLIRVTSEANLAEFRLFVSLGQSPVAPHDQGTSRGS